MITLDILTENKVVGGVTAGNTSLFNTNELQPGSVDAFFVQLTGAFTGTVAIYGTLLTDPATDEWISLVNLSDTAKFSRVDYGWKQLKFVTTINTGKLNQILLGY